MKKILTLSFLLLLPEFAFAAGFQTFIYNFTVFARDGVIPFMIGMAFVFFAFNVIRFFVLEGSNEDGREKAKLLATYGVLTFVLLVTFWGIINLFASSVGLDTPAAVDTVSDYTIRRP